MMSDKMERTDKGADTYQCQNCGQIWTFDELHDIEDLVARIDCGEPVPAGECPACGCLVHPMSADELAARPDQQLPTCDEA